MLQMQYENNCSRVKIGPETATDHQQLY